MKKSIIAIDIVVFAGTIACAVYHNWTAKDIIWSLWISSLILGYSFIVVSSLSIFIRDNMKTSRNIESGKKTSFDKTPPLAFNVFIIVSTFFLFRWLNPVKWLIILGSIVFAVLSILLKKTSMGSGKPTAKNLVRKIFWRFLIG